MKKRYLIIIIIAIILVSGFFLFKFSQTIFRPIAKGFVQWTGRPDCGVWCSWATPDLTYSPNVEINTGKNVFRFESSVQNTIPRQDRCFPTFESANDFCQGAPAPTGQRFEQTGFDEINNCVVGDCYYNVWDSYNWKYIKTMWVHLDGGYYTADPNGNIYYGCYQEIEVFRDGVLVDGVKSTDAVQVKTYFDDGTIQEGRITEKSGVSITASQSSWFHASSCSAFQNAYDLVFSNKSFIIDISTPQEKYIQGEDIQIDVKITNNLAQTNADLTVYYEVPTIIGKATKTEEQNINLEIGENLFHYTIPTTEPTGVLRVKPELVVNYPTSKLSGVNYDFETGEQRPITTFPSFKLGKIEGVWSEVQILSRIVQCYTDADCEGLSQCPGISMYCDVATNTCYYDGVCITQPPEKSIWQKIRSAWSGFIRWITGRF